MRTLILLALLIISPSLIAQSLDYISVRKKDGRVVKDFYSGADILLQTTSGRYLQGPIRAIRNDSVYITLYDIRYYPTVYGSYIKDTVSVTLAGLKQIDIRRIHLGRRQGFFQRMTGPILMIGGAGYQALNILNGTFFDSSVSGSEKGRVAAIGAGAFGIGYLFQELLATDGFSRKKHQIVFVDL